MGGYPPGLRQERGKEGARRESGFLLLEYFSTSHSGYAQNVKIFSQVLVAHT
jgi:hypothetical protein